MKTRRAIIPLAIAAGLLVWVVDAGLDVLIFRGGRFVDLLVLNVPLHELYFRSFVIAVVLASGAILSSVVAQRDRALHRLSEVRAHLRTDEQWYHAVFNSANDAFYIHEIGPDGEAGPIVEVNDVACTMLGYSREEFMGMSPQDVDAPESSALIATRVGEVLRGGGHTFETVHRAKDGTDIPVEVSAHLLRIDERPMVLSVVRDVRRRRAAEERAAHLNQVLRAIRNVNQLITQEKERDQLARRVCEALTETRGYSSAWITLLDEAGQPEVFASAGAGACEATLGDAPVVGEASGVDGAPAAESASLPSWLAPCAQRALGEPGVVAVQKPDPACGPCPLNDPEGANQALSARLVYDERVYGTLSVSLPPGMTIDEEELELVREVADDLAFAFHDLGLEAERAAALAALETSEHRYRALFDNAPVGIFQTTVDGRATIVNPEMAAIVGCATPEEAIARFTDLANQLYVDPERRAQFIEQLQRDGTVQRFEYRARRLDGAEIWLSMDARLAGTDADGTPLIEGFTREVTAYRRAEAQLLEQAEQLRQILISVPEGMVLLDSDHRVMIANPRAAESLADLAGTGAGEILTRLGDRPLETLLTPPPAGLWHDIQHEGRTFAAIAQPVERGNESGAWVLVIDDVTREREAQAHLERQARLAAVGQLASGIAHDFNNLIAVIVLYSQMGLQMDGVPAQLREFLATIGQEAHRATDLIQQILEIGRQGVLERVPMDLAPFLNEQAKLLARILPESIKLSFQHGPTRYVADIDPTRLQQAVFNLALNARDAMPDGGELRLTLARATFEDRKRVPLPDLEPGEWITLTVADTGTGIPSNILPRLFEPFFTTKGPRGTGLGLTQVHGVVTQHDGRVSVRSTPGEGTTFTLYLRPATATAEPSPMPEATGVPLGHGETILIVEDSPAVRTALASALKALNYTVVEAVDGVEALIFIERARTAAAGPPQVGAQPARSLPAAILSDLITPRMGGRALFSAVRRLGLDIPFVILSGHPHEDEVAELAAEGLAGWLAKPADLDELGALLARILR